LWIAGLGPGYLIRCAEQEPETLAPAGESAAEAYARMMSGKAEFRVVLTM
jgi:hypothetical protein